MQKKVTKESLYQVHPVLGNQQSRVDKVTFDKMLTVPWRDRHTRNNKWPQ